LADEPANDRHARSDAYLQYLLIFDSHLAILYLYLFVVVGIQERSRRRRKEIV
jgi:hypothetical protein